MPAAPRPPRPHRSRRGLLGAALGAGACAVAAHAARPAHAARAGGLPPVRVRALTRGPKHHFFGYYGIPPWSRSGRAMVCLESDFHDRMPGPDEPARVGLVDPGTGAFRPLAETRAWNVQQGAMLYWNPLAPDREVIFNDRRPDGEVAAVVLDVESRRKRSLPLAIGGVGNRGRHALCLTYGRLARLRPVVGYPGSRDPFPDDPHPERDGVFLMDLRTGEHRLVLSLGEVYRRLVRRHPELEGRHMFFNHTVFNKTDTRFFVLARAFLDVPGPDGKPRQRLESAMFTARIDGSDVREVIPFGKGVSHFEWRNDRQILATFRLKPDRVSHVLFTDGKQDFELVGDGLLEGDGHCSFAPDGNWIVTDRNHAETIEKSLWIYDLRGKAGGRVATFPMKEARFLGGDLRCDLHPRWSRTGRQICVDALDARDWTRQLHVVDVGP
jgi:hypothetical protein